MPTVLLLSTSDTDLITARASGAEYRWANPSRLIDGELADLLAGVDLAVVRVLGGYRTWQDDIDAGRLGTGEGQAAIDQDPFASPLGSEAVERGVHADLAEATEGNENELVGRAGHGQSLMVGRRCSPNMVSGAPP